MAYTFSPTDRGASGVIRRLLMRVGQDTAGGRYCNSEVVYVGVSEGGELKEGCPACVVFPRTPIRAFSDEPDAATFILSPSDAREADAAD